MGTLLTPSRNALKRSKTLYIFFKIQIPIKKKNQNKLLLIAKLAIKNRIVIIKEKNSKSKKITTNKKEVKYENF